jgi:hypothetical protein
MKLRNASKHKTRPGKFRWYNMLTGLIFEPPFTSTPWMIIPFTRLLVVSYTPAYIPNVQVVRRIEIYK